MTDRLAQARAEAERRFAIPADDEHVLVDTNQVEAFVAGVAWADANRTITREECLHVGGSVQSGWPLERILGQIGIEVTDDE